jgi:hypothetical protein
MVFAFIPPNDDLGDVEWEEEKFKEDENGGRDVKKKLRSGSEGESDSGVEGTRAMRAGAMRAGLLNQL